MCIDMCVNISIDMWMFDIDMSVDMRIDKCMYTKMDVGKCMYMYGCGYEHVDRHVDRHVRTAVHGRSAGW